MLFLAIAWVSTLAISNNLYLNQSRLYKVFTWLGLFVGVIGGILSKNTIGIAIPAIGIYLLIGKRKYLSRVNIKGYLKESWKKILLLFGCVLLFFVLWILFIPLKGAFSRFSFEYYLQLAAIFFTKPHPNFFEAIIGPLISPGKSIFVYSPILVLAIIGSFKRWKIAWPAWLYLFLLIVGQALFYDDEWSGHINWGLRFILPALPPLFIAAIPAIDSWLKTGKGMLGLAVLGAISTAIQLIGSLAPVRQFYIELTSIDPSLIKTAAIWRIDYSPILWNIDWLLGGGALDLALVRVGKNAIPILVGFLLVGFLVGFAIFHPAKKSLPIVSVGLLAGMTIAMLFSYKQDPEYYLARLDLRASQEVIESEGISDDVVIIKSYSSPVWYYWMNWADQDNGWISLPLSFPKPSLIKEYQGTDNPEIALDEATLSLFRQISDDNQRVWLLVPSDTPGATLNIEAEWLTNNSISSTNWKFEGNSTDTQLYLFEFAEQ